MTRDQLKVFLMLPDSKWVAVKRAVKRYYVEGHSLPPDAEWVAGLPQDVWDGHALRVDNLRVENHEQLQVLRQKAREKARADNYRAYMREYMRKRRAAQKQEAQHERKE